MLPAGIVAAVAGLWSLYASARPSRRTSLAVLASSSVWIGPADLARLAAAAAETGPEVLNVRASASRRTITVRAEVTAAGDPAIRKAITTATTPRIKVRTRTGDH
ncbi:MAG TPA: hypothetical protein VET27_20700 [Mycobacterium sp.]|nr:hypothetical protein [Mycobacterium sp.]